MSLERMTSPFDSPIRSHVIASPAASDRSDEGQAGQSPRLEAPSAQVSLTNGNLKKIACSREETVETLSAKVLPRSSPQTNLQRMPFHPPARKACSIPACSSTADGQQVISSRAEMFSTCSPVMVRIRQLCYLSLEG